VDDAPRDYIDRLVQATVGIEIVIERLEGKWKTSRAT
jgi:transcriptional regulator